MKQIPVDPSRIRILSAGPTAPATNLDGTPRINKAGQLLVNVPVLVLVDGGRAESVNLRVPGPVPPLPELGLLDAKALIAWYWVLDSGKSGVSLTAAEVRPAQPGRPTGAR